MDDIVFNADEGLERKRAVPARRTCVLVLGMHRSGTSALTRVLNLLGCELPNNLIGTGIGNDAGHWEPRSLVLFNDALLASAGSRWDDWQHLNPNWYKSGSYASHKAQARDLLDTEFRNFPLFVIKDPRILKILPFWLDVLEEENIDAKIVIPIRHPDEVAASLEMRDMMDLNYGRLLWLRHILDAERDSRGHSRVFCTYDQLLRNWRLIASNMEDRLDLVFPRRSALVDLEIDASLRDDLRHQVSNLSDIRGSDGVSAWLQQSYALLSDWSDHGEDQRDFPKLDLIRSEFDEASRHFASLILPGSRSGEAGEGGRQLNALRTQVEELTGDLAATQAELAEASRHDFGRLSAERDEILAESQRLKEEVAAREEALRDHEARISALREAAHEAVQAAEREASSLIGDRDRLQEQLALTENMLRQREEEIDQTRTELAVQKRLNENVDGLREKLAVSEAWVFNLAGDRQAAEKIAENAREELARERRDAVTKDNEISRLKTQLEISGRTLQAAQKSLTDVSGAHDEALGAIRKMNSNASELKARLSAGQAEIAELTRMLLRSEEGLNALQKKMGGEVSELKSRLGMGHAEIAELTRMLMRTEDNMSDMQKDAQWLQKVADMLRTYPSWWHLMPKKWRERRLHSRLLKKGLFDGMAYLDRYADVADAGMDPLQHYLLHGMAEKRIRFEAVRN